MGTEKKVERKGCRNCKFEKLHMFSIPCSTCSDRDAWEPKVKPKASAEVKMCTDCVNEGYCKNHSRTRLRCLGNYMNGWSPKNVTVKATPQEHEEFLKSISREILDVFNEPPVKEEEEEDVSKQSHYTRFKIQPLEFCKANDLGYLEGNVIKYVCRYPYKGQAMKDLLKARDYIDHLIEKQKENENESPDRV